jgi:DNA-binding transcriptional regulator YdaS (Cro superfamily)
MKTRDHITPEYAALKKAVEIIGGTMAVSRAFGIKPPSVSRWLAKGYAPVERCLKLEKLTRGAVTRYDLRPDIFGAKPGRKRK